MLARHGLREKEMMKFIIITGTQNSGKTTTARLVYQSLWPQAINVHLTDAYEKDLPKEHPLIEEGKPIDFIAGMKVNGKDVAIVSLGDYPEYLKRQIAIYLNQVDFFVCCLRTRDREGSTRRMLYTDYANYPKEEFWTEYSEDKSLEFKVKEKVVERIKSAIMSN